MSSLKDLARECGVSVATVSKALNGQSDISAATRDRVREAVGRVWPDGYPLDDMLADSRVIHLHCVRGSLVLSAQTAIALGSEPDGGQAAVAVLKEISRAYGPLFDPKGNGPKDVAAWVLEHRRWAVDMADLLVRAGLENKGLKDTVERILS